MKAPRYLLYIFVFILSAIIVSLSFSFDVDLEHSKCTPPLKEEEEFEPALCSFELPAVKTIKIFERFKDKKDPYYHQKECAAFLATKDTDIIKFFQNANRVSTDDMHAKLAETSPCRISGTFEFKNGDIAEWSINSHIQLGRLIINPHIEHLEDDPYLHLYCPKSCKFIPTYYNHSK
jgi:hypothetical protein